MLDHFTRLRAFLITRAEGEAELCELPAEKSTLVSPEPIGAIWPLPKLKLTPAFGLNWNPCCCLLLLSVEPVPPLPWPVMGGAPKFRPPVFDKGKPRLGVAPIPSPLLPLLPAEKLNDDGGCVVDPKLNWGWLDCCCWLLCAPNMEPCVWGRVRPGAAGCWPENKRSAKWKLVLVIEHHKLRYDVEGCMQGVGLLSCIEWIGSSESILLYVGALLDRSLQ